jgi:hypothetical protein
MTTRDTETLAQLLKERVGERGSGTSYEDISRRAIDPDSGYQPSASVLWNVANRGVKINPKLVGAIAAGLGLPVERVQAAAAREYLGWQVSHPASQGPADDDEVISVGHRRGLTPADMPLVEDAIENSRDLDRPE